jgi:hypothetical protein
MIYAVLIIAAVALGLAAFAIYVAWDARSRSIDAQQRTARHQLEHRTGVEDEGLRRHRAVEEPATAQIAAQPADPAPPTGQITAAEPPSSGPYARLRASAQQRDTGDLPETAASPAAHPRRPGTGPNFAAPPPARPSLPPPGRIDRDR